MPPRIAGGHGRRASIVVPDFNVNSLPTRVSTVQSNSTREDAASSFYSGKLAEEEDSVISRSYSDEARDSTRNVPLNFGDISNSVHRDITVYREIRESINSRMRGLSRGSSMQSSGKATTTTVPRSHVEITASVLQVMKSLNENPLSSNAKAHLEREYDSRFVIAVIGGARSGKEEILTKECKNIDVPILDSTIGIVRNMYEMGQTVLVEYWYGPESPVYAMKTSKCLAGHAGTILFFDVTNPDGLQELIPWLDSLKLQRPKKPYGHVALLMANKIDQPSRRLILQEDAIAFAEKYGLQYHETSASDDIDYIHDIFYKAIATVIKMIPEGNDRQSRKSGKIPTKACPTGLQLGLALAPTSKFKFKQRMDQEQDLAAKIDLAFEADWIV